MDRKMICGVLVTVIGLVFSALCFIYAALNPWSYDDLNGLLGSLLGTHMLLPSIVSMLIMLSGLGYCFYLAYKKK